jgi:2-methylfumaryl-CoA isomerase
MPGSPLQVQGLTREPVTPAPELGEHTDRVLAEVLGLSDARIGELRERGVVA